MGVSIVVPGADYSAIAVDQLNLILPHSPTHVYETRSSEAVAVRNLVTKTVDGDTPGGDPTFASTKTTVDATNRLRYGANHNTNSTFAVIYDHGKNAGSDSYVAGIFGSAPTTNGACYLLRRANGNIRLESTTHVGTGTSVATVNAQVMVSSAIPTMVFGVVSDTDSALTVYAPRSGLSASAALVSGRTFAPPTPRQYQSCIPNATSVAADIFGFARWNAVLTTSQMDEIYLAAQSYYALRGVTI